MTIAELRAFLVNAVPEGGDKQVNTDIEIDIAIDSVFAYFRLERFFRMLPRTDSPLRFNQLLAASSTTGLSQNLVYQASNNKCLYSAEASCTTANNTWVLPPVKTTTYEVDDYKSPYFCKVFYPYIEAGLYTFKAAEEQEGGDRTADGDNDIILDRVRDRTYTNRRYNKTELLIFDVIPYNGVINILLEASNYSLTNPVPRNSNVGIKSESFGNYSYTLQSGKIDNAFNAELLSRVDRLKEMQAIEMGMYG